jgi:hypothetical protein
MLRMAYEIDTIIIILEMKKTMHQRNSNLPTQQSLWMVELDSK